MARKQELSSCLAKKLLATHSIGSIGYHLCLFMQTQFHPDSYLHVCTNKMHSLANLQDLIPTLAGLCFLYLCLPKSWRFARECVYLYLYGYN